jgi:hypothetical protein
MNEMLPDPSGPSGFKKKCPWEQHRGLFASRAVISTRGPLVLGSLRIYEHRFLALLNTSKRARATHDYK